MDDRRQIFAWAMYDWANSAFATTVLVAVFPLYFGSVIVPEGGVRIGPWTLHATALLGFASSFYSLVIFLLAPALGAIADYSAARKRFLLVCCYLGSLATLTLALWGPGDVWQSMLVFVISQLGFVGGNIFYDAFLPQIASEERMDWVSGLGFAYGYIGGGLQYALCLGLIAGAGTLGITTELAARTSMAFTGVWWAGFATVTFLLLKEPAASHRVLTTAAYLRLGFSRMFATARKVGRFKHLLLFLIAFMVFNDAIQTVIKMASIYGQQELRIPQTSIMLTLLIIQFVAFGGALLFGRLAHWLGTKRALQLSLVLWSGVVVYGYTMSSAGEFMVLGAIVGLVMGGSQALSRSLYGSMIPKVASAEFYGFYSVFTKFSAIFGPAVFGIVEVSTGSSRNAILSLVIFFVVGLALLSFVNVNSAREARDQTPF